VADLPEKTDSFISQDGLKIFYRHYPAPNEKARIVIAHGLSEHSGRYGNVIERLFPKDISIWALDHRGHGQSDGARGHISSFIHTDKASGVSFCYLRKEARNE
jgi:acylglycerol lipase